MSNYDFSRFEEICEEIVSSRVPNRMLLNRLRDELNKFFNDSKCIEVLYNSNNDKLFYGMTCLPSTTHKDFMNIYSGSYNRFSKYYIEIDCKLLDPVLNITARELVAILLHEVGHIVDNSIVSREISDQIHYVVSKEGVNLDYIETCKNYGILNIGLLRAIRKATSIFEKQKKEYIADQFVVDCGYGMELESVYDKTVKNRNHLNTEQGKFIALIWSLQMFSLRNRKATILQNLEEGKEIEPILLFKKAYEKTIKDVKTSNLRRKGLLEASISDEAHDFLCESKIFRALKYPGLRDIEDDLYEFKIKMNIIDSNVEALEMIRKFNLRINTIETYLVKEKISGKELDRLLDIKNKYIALREELITKGTYEKSEYGLFVKYPKINGYGSRV